MKYYYPPPNEFNLIFNQKLLTKLKYRSVFTDLKGVTWFDTQKKKTENNIK